MGIRFLYTVLLSFACFSGGVRAETSLGQAIACFDTMLSEAKAGVSFSSMVDGYVSYTAIAAKAAQVQDRILWNDLTENERAPYIKAVKAYFEKEALKVAKGVGKRDYVVLSSVQLSPQQHKKVGDGYQLAGRYITEGGTKENFAISIFKTGGKCQINDARWRDAWLSRYVPLP